MKSYTLQARLDKSITTVSIMARDTFTAKVLAVSQIRSSHVSDNRWGIGEITLKDPKGEIVWTLPAEKKEEGK